MRKIEERKEVIKKKLPDLLREYKGLIGMGCINGCKKCYLGKVIIPDSKIPYEYAEGKLIGPLSICDFLGILLEGME